MKQISGYVLVKETGSGIPNLVVTAYDSEKSIQELVVDGPNGGGLSKAIHEIVGDRPSEGGLSLGHLGKRIGSVLTDSDGGFILKGEDLEFQGNESRPDLLIIVFAPEDVQDLNTPYPSPPEQRILYISTLPREDAGAEEAFVIRLLQEQLDHFHLTANTSSNQSSAAGDRFATALEDTWNFGDRLKDRIKTRMREEQQKSEELQSKAEAKFRNLSAIPKYLRDDRLTNSTLLLNGKKDLAANLHSKQDQVVENGLERLKTRNTVIHLGLTENELRDLGLHVAGDEIVGDIDASKLTEKVRAKINGLDLIRKRGLNNPSPEDLIKKYSLESDPVRGNGEHESAKSEDVPW